MTRREQQLNAILRLEDDSRLDASERRLLHAIRERLMALPGRSLSDDDRATIVQLSRAVSTRQERPSGSLLARMPLPLKPPTPNHAPRQ